MTTIAQGVYVSPQLPIYWVVSDGCQAWIVDTMPGGWARRHPYMGHCEALAPAIPEIAHMACKVNGTPLNFAGVAGLDELYLTSAEAAILTGTSESGWRNRAAAGEIEGAVKKGATWLIPRSSVRT